MVAVCERLITMDDHSATRDSRGARERQVAFQNVFCSPRVGSSRLFPAESQLMYCSRLRLNKEGNIKLQPVATRAQQILNY